MKKQYLVSYRIQDGDIRTTAVDAIVGDTAKDTLKNIADAVVDCVYGCFKDQLEIISINQLN